MRKLLKGIVVPIITPLTQEQKLDGPGLERLVDHLLQGGVNGLFLAGTTGEGPALSYEIRKETVLRVCEQVGSRIPVVVAAMDSSPAETVKMIAYAAKAGASAAAVAPPFYMPVSQSDIVRYGKAIAEQSPLPIYMYNVPNPNLPRLTLDALEQLADLENVLGFKDSGGSRNFLLAAIRVFSKRPETSVLVGPENLLLDALRDGGDGGVSGGATLFPQLYTELYKACARGEWEVAESLFRLVLRVDHDFYHVGEAESSLIRGVKAAASLMGICSATMASPYVSATPEESATIALRLDLFQKDLEGDLRPLQYNV